MPHGLICPISHEPFVDPVVASDGFTYDRAMWQTWADTQTRTGTRCKSPMTNLWLDTTTVHPNQSIKVLLQAELEKATPLRTFEAAVLRGDVAELNRSTYWPSHVQHAATTLVDSVLQPPPPPPHKDIGICIRSFRWLVHASRSVGVALDMRAALPRAMQNDLVWLVQELLASQRAWDVTNQADWWKLVHSVDMAKLLLTVGCTPDYLCPTWKNTPLCLVPSLDVVRWLVEDQKVDVTAETTRTHPILYHVSEIDRSTGSSTGSSSKRAQEAEAIVRYLVDRVPKTANVLSFSTREPPAPFALLAHYPPTKPALVKLLVDKYGPVPRHVLNDTLAVALACAPRVQQNAGPCPPPPADDCPMVQWLEHLVQLVGEAAVRLAINDTDTVVGETPLAKLFLCRRPAEAPHPALVQWAFRYGADPRKCDANKPQSCSALTRIARYDPQFLASQYCQLNTDLVVAAKRAQESARPLVEMQRQLDECKKESAAVLSSAAALAAAASRPPPVAKRKASSLFEMPPSTRSKDDLATAGADESGVERAAKRLKKTNSAPPVPGTPCDPACAGTAAQDGSAPPPPQVSE